MACLISTGFSWISPLNLTIYFATWIRILLSQVRQQDSFRMAASSANSLKYPRVKLPHPFLTTYRVQSITGTTPAKRKLVLESQPTDGRPLIEALHLDSLSWIDLSFPVKDQSPPESDNSAWARARRSPSTIFEWTSDCPSLGQIWNLIHAIYLATPTNEYFRLILDGRDSDILRQELLTTGLAIEHPKPWHRPKVPPRR